MTTSIGILTAGGDSPGLNAAIRGVGKAAINLYGWNVLGFQNGFRGLLDNRFIHLDSVALAGILTQGGTILGTSRDKPDKMLVGGKSMDMTDAMVETYHKNQLDALVCLGGGGTAKNAWTLSKKGLNVITLPKTIDNDLDKTFTTFGFDTAVAFATECLDRLHSTAESHQRVMVVEVMGRYCGYLAFMSMLATGAERVYLHEEGVTMHDLVADVEEFRNAFERGKRLGLSLAEIKDLIGMYNSTEDETPQLTECLRVMSKRREALEQQREDIVAVLGEIDMLEKQCIHLLAGQSDGVGPA